MAIFDNDGSSNHEIGKLFDNDGTSNHQIGKVYDNNGTTNSLIYSFAEYLIPSADFANTANWTHTAGTMTVNSDNTIQFTSKSGSTNTRHNCSIEVDLTNYSYITITMSGYSAAGGTSSVKFRMASVADSDTTFQIAYPTTNGTYSLDISSYSGKWTFYCYANYGQYYTVDELYLS